ncbi:hypothetical protein N7540_005199 [Penicillium herquei]|nr:hypothetical protein N7540_005199 [Penicillium herquei]
MSGTQEPIAIIGTACRFPGGSNSPSKLWELLKNPRDVLKRVPSNRYSVEAYYHPDPTHHGTTDVQESYFLDEDPLAFDNGFFNITSAECEAADPQHRMLLECVYDSLTDAGIPMESLRGSQTSAFVGLMCDDWSGLLTQDWDNYPMYASTGMGRSIASNRISYLFDWHGPSMTIDTACSSSMVALHQAAMTIQSGESRVALAAGSNLLLSPANYIAESKLRMLSPDSRSRMWDVDANGYARGEGIAAVIMKSLKDAIADGDNIQCVLRGSMVNQDGRTPGLTMPSGIAQAELIKQTYIRAGLDINVMEDRPQFFQAHGTGTQAGDPQEAQAISTAYFENGNPSPTNEKLLVGSVKTVIGHTEGTAGLASLITAIEAIRDGYVPPNMLFNTLNPKVAPFYDNLEIPTEAVKWPAVKPGHPRRASVNSFGFGGTNAHAIIESYEGPKRLVAASEGPQITPFVFSAASDPCLRSIMKEHKEFLENHPGTNLRDLAFTLQDRRSALPYRASISASSVDELTTKLEALLGDSDLKTRYSNKPDAKILGVFTGQGAQWPRMGAKLLELSPLVSEIVDKLDQSLATLPVTDRPSWTIRNELLAAADKSRMAEAELSQPLCTAVQVILVNLLRLVGIQLKAVVGHSSGEIGAAYSAGLVSAEDAIRIAYYRGFHAKLACSTDGGKGAMMAVGTSLEDAQEFCELEQFEGRLKVAACNSSSSVTISGDEAAIDEAIEIFKDEQTFVRKLKVDTAYHSHHMLPCAGPYLESLANASNATEFESTTVWHSSVTPGQVMSKENLVSQYWVDNMVNPVMFAPAVTNALEADGPFDLILEVGPHPALKGPATSTLEELNQAGIPYSGVLGRGKDDLTEFSNALGFVWTHLGRDGVSFSSFDLAFEGKLQPKQFLPGLPLYPFNHSRTFGNLSRISTTHMNNHAKLHPLLGRQCIESTANQEVSWRNVIRPNEISWLRCHTLQGQIIAPATAYVSMAMDAAVILATRNPVSLKLEGLSIDRAMSFKDEGAGLEVYCTAKIIENNESQLVLEFACYSSLANDAPMVRNACGRVIADFEQVGADAMPIISSESFNLIPQDIGNFYQAFWDMGYHYETPFNGIRTVNRKPNYAEGILEDVSGTAWEDELTVHPAMLDTALQTSSAAYSAPGDNRMFAMRIPTFIESIVVNPRFTRLGEGKPSGINYQSVITASHHGETLADIHLFTAEGNHSFVQVEGLTLRPFSAPTPEDDSTIFSDLQYKSMNLDGELAFAGEQPSAAEKEKALDLERVSFFYIRKLIETITAEEKANTLPHYQKLLEWAAYVEGLVASGSHATIGLEHLMDTQEVINSLIAKNQGPDWNMVQIVGENLPTAIRESESMIKYMAKDGALAEFFTSNQTPNKWLARMVEQLAHRYPRMHALEVGADTWGSTKAILPGIEDAFSSYTFTHASSTNFEAGEQAYEKYGHRMHYKTFDMERAPDSQGFTDGSYDLVVANLICHATSKVEEVLKNIRQLLRPGAWLMMHELTSNDALRMSFPMTGLPTWWLGADSGRPWGPMLSLAEWDAALKNSGFSGIETSTPSCGATHPSVVFAAQAVDSGINILRSPLSAPADAAVNASKTLTILGGTTSQVKQFTEKFLANIGDRFKTVIRIPTLEETHKQGLAEGTSIVSLLDLDDPIMRVPSSEKHDALKYLLRNAKNVLWTTCGSRVATPHSNMMVAFGRTMRAENPHMRLQVYDIEKVDEEGAKILAEATLRHEFLETIAKEKAATGLLYSPEPEIYMEGGRAVIPRLYPRKNANLRYNTSRRVVTREADPKSEAVVIRNNGSSVTLHDVSPLRRVTLSVAPTTTVQVSHSLLDSIFVENAGYLMLAAGTDSQTKEDVFAFGLAAESSAPSLSAWTVPQKGVDAVAGIASIAAYLTAEKIFKLASTAGTVIVHDAERSLADALLRTAKAKGVQLLLTTSQKVHRPEAIYIHPRLPQRLISRQIPKKVSAFVNLERESTADSTGHFITKFLSRNSAIFGRSSVLGSEVELSLEPSIEEGQKALQSALNSIENLGLIEEPSTPVLISECPTAVKNEGDLTVMDWRVDSTAVEVSAIDDCTIFDANKTYVLFGLSGQVGQAIAQWMIEHGARHVVLTSRSPNVDPQFVEAMAFHGATLSAMSCDVTSRDSLKALLAEVNDNMPPLGGVANGAMIMKDAIFENMSFEDFMTCLRPKVEGTILLDELLYDTPLEFFIVFSSLTAVTGNSGQCNYAAANAFMAAMARKRRARGLAASAMDISSIVGLGYVERSTLDNEHFNRLGHKNIGDQDVLTMFAEAIATGHPDCTEDAEFVSGVSRIYTDAPITGQILTDLKFAHFVKDRPDNSAQAGGAQTAPVRVQLGDAEDLAQIEEIIKTGFVARLKKTLQIPDEDTINETMSLIEQGVDSLMAVEVRSWFLKELDVDMPVLKVLAGGTIQDLVADAIPRLPAGMTKIQTGGEEEAKVESDSASATESSESGIETPVSSASVDPKAATENSPAEIQVPLSFGQNRFWFLHNYIEDKKTFNMAVMFKLTGALRVDDLSKAVETVAQRHEIMRTRIVPEDDDDSDDEDDESTGEMRQGILAKPTMKLEKLSVTQEQVDEEFKRMHEHDWDLHSWEPLKIRLLTVSDDVHYVLIGAHHIAFDGYSFSVLFLELEQAYSGKPMAPMPLASQYRSFGQKQRDDYESGRMQKSIDFQRSALPTDLPPIPLLPFAKVETRPQMLRYGLNTASATLSPAQSAKVKALARQAKSTNFHVYVALLQTQIYRLLPELQEFCIGIADANRLDPKFMGSMGFLLNLLPIHVRREFSENQFKEMVQDSRNKIYNTLQHSQLPFDLLLNELNINRASESNPLFQVFVDYRQVPQDRASWGGDCTVSEERWGNAQTGYDISLEITEDRNGGTLFQLGLQDALYSKESSEAMLKSFLSLVEEYTA